MGQRAGETASRLIGRGGEWVGGPGEAVDERTGGHVDEWVGGRVGQWTDWPACGQVGGRLRAGQRTGWLAGRRVGKPYVLLNVKYLLDIIVLQQLPLSNIIVLSIKQPRDQNCTPIGRLIIGRATSPDDITTNVRTYFRSPRVALKSCVAWQQVRDVSPGTMQPVSVVSYRFA